MNIPFTSLCVASLLFLTGCSSRQYYEPKETLDFQQKSTQLESKIIDLQSNGATLENHTYVNKKGIQTKLQENYRFLNFVDETLLSTNDMRQISFENETEQKTFQFDKNIVNASKKGDLLAFTSIDNTITLFDTKVEKTVFKEYLQYSSLNNIKMANPLFLDKIVLFPTLDGKVVIVDIANKTIVKTLNIDPKSEINNIIFLEEKNDALIAASSYKLFSFVDGKANIKDLDILQIIIHKEFIYVATLDGEIIKYDLSLNRIASQKFKFAKIHALTFGTHLYALESQDFLIQISENFEDVQVYDFAFKEEEKVFSLGDTLYFEDKYIQFK